MAEIAPDTFLVRIVGPGGQPAGMGMLAGPAQIVTCAHVVNAALGRDARSQPQPDPLVVIEFPFLTGTTDRVVAHCRARVRLWLPPAREGAAGDDLAGLEVVEGRVPDGARPARLAFSPPRPGRTVRVFGYPGDPPRAAGAWVATQVQGRVGGGRLQLDSGVDPALRVQPGFSGAPVVDDAAGRVVGLLAVAAPAWSGDRDSYAISADRLRLAWPEVLDPHFPARPGSPARAGQPPAGAEPLTVLHLSDPQFGQHHVFGGNGLTRADQARDSLHARLHDDLAGLAREHRLRPDLIVVTGDLAERGLGSEFVRVTEFLSELAEAVDLPRSRVAVVPGNHDVNRPICEGYFAIQAGEERPPVAPYFPKWKPFVAAFEEFYADVPGVSFSPDEPWTLFEMPDLAVVVAGLNSTMAESHREEDHYGWLGEAQLRWFADRLAGYRARGWLRLAAVHHNAVRGAVADDENLRDVEDLDRMLGQTGLVNLLLHGHTHDGRIHRLPSGLIVLSTGSAAVAESARPIEIPNQYQLITLGPERLTRHARQYAPGQRRWIGDTRISGTGSDWRDQRSHRFNDVDAAFPPALRPDAPAGAGAGRTGGSKSKAAGRSELPDPTGPGGDRDPARLDNFLSRVAEATRVRFPEATVSPRPDDGYLRVADPLPGGTGVEMWPVGAVDGSATRDALDGFTRVHARFAAADPSVRSELVHTGRPAAEELVAEARRRGIRLRSFVDYQGLLDLRPLVERQTARLTDDSIYPARMYLPQRYRLANAHDDGPVEPDLHERVVEWLDVPTARFVMVLGDFGRGKTALLRQLARILPERLAGRLPVLVELRSLEKAPTLDELLGAHLLRQQVDDISPAKLRYMIRTGRLVLLFDGFDELELRVGYDNAADYLQVLLESVSGQAKLVLTSRTQHFRSTAQVRTALGERIAALSATRVVVLEDFAPEQIRQFLTNLYDGDTAAARARFDLLSDIEDLLGLARNPRMLGFIAGLDETRLREAQQRTGRISAAELYRELIDTWLAGEARRQQHHRGLPTLDEQERLAACTALALRLWDSVQPTIPISDLSAEVTATLTTLSERGYSTEQAAHSVGSGSLLVRTDDSLFAFIHQSIMEWLVADAAADALTKHGTFAPLTTRRLSPLMTDFLHDLAGSAVVHRWAAEVLADPSGSEIAKQNGFALQRRLRVAAPQADAESSSPRRELVGVDLRATDLTGQRLRGADLRHAVLRGMRLRDVDLTAADLREADFSGARLVGGSLHAAVVAGSRWERAAVLGTHGWRDHAGAAELRDAAIAGRDRPTPQISPTGPARCASFSPDGALLAVGRGHSVEVIDQVAGHTVRLLHGHTGPVNAVAFSPDGTQLATASGDHTARLWDSATGTHRTTLTGHDRPVNAVAFSPDGTQLATASYDGTARLWDSTTAQPVAVLVPLAGDGYATLLPDGSYKLAGDAGDSLWWAIKLCRFAPGELDPYVPGLARLPADVPIRTGRSAR